MTTKRTITIVDDDDDAVVEQHRGDELHGEETEVVTATPGPWHFMRGWLAFLQGAIALTLLAVLSLLGFRLAFALAGANPANNFVDFIYDVTAPLVEPFEGIVNESIEGDSVFEPETVIAMGVYTVAALLVIAFLSLIKSAPTPEREEVTRHRHQQIDTHA